MTARRVASLAEPGQADAWVCLLLGDGCRDGAWDGRVGDEGLGHGSVPPSRTVCQPELTWRRSSGSCAVAPGEIEIEGVSPGRSPTPKWMVRRAPRCGPCWCRPGPTAACPRACAARRWHRLRASHRRERWAGRCARTCCGRRPGEGARRGVRRRRRDRVPRCEGTRSRPTAPPDHVHVAVRIRVGQGDATGDEGLVDAEVGGDVEAACRARVERVGLVAADVVAQLHPHPCLGSLQSSSLPIDHSAATPHVDHRRSHGLDGS